MKPLKPRWRTLLLVVPLAALLLYIALNFYAWEDETIYVRAGKEAIENPYLAYGRLLERMGAKPLQPRSPSALDAPPARGALVLADRRLAYMTPERVRHILGWVESGGRLVVEAEDEGIDDPVLDALGIERVMPPRDSAARRARINEMAKRSGPGSVAIIDWPELGKPLKVRMGGDFLMSLRDARIRSDEREAKLGDRVVALSFPQGEGRVIVLMATGFLRNNAIGELDHAELGWRLVAKSAAVMLFLRMQSPPFMEWVLRDAWPVLVAAGLLLLFWLARIIPRFGPLAPDAPPVRRSLLEHVVASGRFLWSRGQGAALLEALRDRAWRAARRRGVGAPGASRDRSVAAVAALAGMSEARARQALVAPAPNAAAFVDSAAALQAIETRLARRDDARPQRKT